jgi:hypothetical protein
MGFSPLAQSSPPGWLTPTGSGLGRSNRPTPAPSLSPLSSPRCSGEPQSPPPSPGVLARLRRTPPPPPGANATPQHPLPPPPTGFVIRFLSEEIRGWIPLGFRRLRLPPSPMPRWVLSRCLLCDPRWSWCVCKPVEAPRCGAPDVLVEDIPR